MTQTMMTLDQSQYTSNQSKTNLPLQINPKRSLFRGIHQREQSNLDFQQLLNQQSASIEALNQRELMLQDRELNLIQNQKDYEQAYAKFKQRVVKQQQEAQQLKIRKQSLDEEWGRVDAMRKEALQQIEESCHLRDQLDGKQEQLTQFEHDLDQIQQNLQGYEEELREKERHLE